MSGDRDDILSAIRAAVGERDNPAPPVKDYIVPARATGDAAALRARFIEQAEFAGASIAEAAGPDDIATVIAGYVEAMSGDISGAIAPDGGLDTLRWDENLARFRVGPPTPDDRVTVTGAVAGIAETGTVLVRCGSSVANAAHLLGEAHIVVLPMGRIVGGYEQAWAVLREAAPEAVLPRAATFITGPSRTADIEKTPQIGVHGPRRLHIVLFDGEIS
ncbi:MAG: lactate utilization protein [Alphaproteobacteria bacterium]